MTITNPALGKQWNFPCTEKQCGISTEAGDGQWIGRKVYPTITLNG